MLCKNCQRDYNTCNGTCVDVNGTQFEQVVKRTLVFVDMDGTVFDSMNRLAAIGEQVLAALEPMNASSALAYYHSTQGRPFEHQLAGWHTGLPSDGRPFDNALAAYGALHKLYAPGFALTAFGRALAERSLPQWFDCVLVSSTAHDVFECYPQRLLHGLPFDTSYGVFNRHLRGKGQQIAHAINAKQSPSIERVLLIGDTVYDQIVASNFNLEYASVHSLKPLYENDEYSVQNLWGALTL